MKETQKHLTEVLRSAGAGEPLAEEQVLPLLYEELRRLTAARMAHEQAGPILQPTALVHEAWLRLINGHPQGWQTRAHFFGAAAEAMRRILIEIASLVLTTASIILVASMGFLTGCDGGSNTSSGGGALRGGQLMRATSFKYGYGGQFGPFDIADTAEAYNGDVLVGQARAIELQDSTTGGPRVLKIQVTHYSTSGEPVYTGCVYIQAGFGGGRVVREEDMSGSRQATVFGSWPMGH